MRTIRSSFAIVIVAFAAAISVAQNEKQGTLNDYKWQFDATWWFSNPTGAIHGANSSGEFDLARDFGFGSYSTFSGKIDWHFKRKHHLTLRIAPVTSESTRTITRQIEFQGVTYNVGAQVSADINTFSIAPGYQYDFIRRDHGYLGGIVQMNVVHVTSSLTGIGTINGVTSTRTASGSILAPLPNIGPIGRWYPMHDSDRIALDGYIQGMYFFGYGDFITARATAVVKVHPHWNLIAGYEMGTNLSVHGKTNNIGVRLTQKGPIAGIEASW